MIRPHTSRQRQSEQHKSTGWARRLGDASDHRRDRAREEQRANEAKDFR